MDELNFDPAKAWSTLAVVILGTFMSIIDSTVVSVALPTIMNVFGVALSSVQWITTAYMLAMAIIIPLTPYLSKVFGSERLYMVAMIIFTSSSFLCGFAWSLNTMIVFRILQAIGGGMMTPIGMGMIISSFPPSKRGVAFGVFGIAAMAAPAFGPTLGGYIVEYLGWRFIFYVNIPIGIVAVLLATIFFKFSKRNPFPKFDILGFISSGIGTSFLIYLLGKNQSIDWNNPMYVYMTIIGIGALAFFIVNELYTDAPLLDLRLLKDANFTLSLVLTVFMMLMMISMSYTLPVFLQNFKGLSALQSGETLLPSSLVMAVAMPIAGKLSDTLGEKGTKWIIAGGIIVCGVATFAISTLMNINASVTDIIIMSSIRNIGLGIAMMPARTLGLTEIGPKESQRASAMQMFIQQFSSSAVVASVTMLITNRFNYNYAGATSQLTPFNLPLMDAVQKLTAQFISQGLSAADAATQAMTTILQGVYAQNYVLAIQFTIFTCAVIGLASLVFVPFFKTKKKEPAVLSNRF